MTATEGRTGGRLDPRDRVPPLGFRNYWYPVAKTRDIGRKPRHVRLLGEDLVVFRSHKTGKIFALNDRCPHRGAPLSLGRCEFDGTVTCPYHGWVFDGESGECRAALMEGPNSPAVGRAKVQAYPTAEFKHILWIFMGEIEPPPLEEDLPEEFARADTYAWATIDLWGGNWRIMLENGLDNHAPYLHRYSMELLLQKMTSSVHIEPVELPDGKGIGTAWTAGPPVTDHPGLGRWPKPEPWRVVKPLYTERFPTDGSAVTIATRLPGYFELHHHWKGETYYQWLTPVDENTTRVISFTVTNLKGWEFQRFRWLYHRKLRWIHNIAFNGQDDWILSFVKYYGPERLVRGDSAVNKWRRWAPANARGRGDPAEPTTPGAEPDEASTVERRLPEEVPGRS